MADGDVPRLSKSGGSAPYGSTQSQSRHHTGEKRSLADENDTEPEKKKTGAISFGMRPKPAGAATSGMKFNMKLGSSGGSSGATSKPAASAAPVKMSLAGSQKPKEPPVLKKKKSASVAQAFNQDDDSEEEEMPPEAKMRMRNMGRETPTAAGPNSFGKNMLGFCDRQKIIQRELEKQMEEIAATSKGDD